MSEWRSVEDGLPDESEQHTMWTFVVNGSRETASETVVVRVNGMYDFGWYVRFDDGGGEWRLAHHRGTVTHWMPLEWGNHSARATGSAGEQKPRGS